MSREGIKNTSMLFVFETSVKHYSTPRSLSQICAFLLLMGCAQPAQVAGKPSWQPENPTLAVLLGPHPCLPSFHLYLKSRNSVRSKYSLRKIKPCCIPWGVWLALPAVVASARSPDEATAFSPQVQESPQGSLPTLPAHLGAAPCPPPSMLTKVRGAWLGEGSVARWEGPAGCSPTPPCASRALRPRTPGHCPDHCHVHHLHHGRGHRSYHHVLHHEDPALCPR